MIPDVGFKSRSGGRPRLYENLLSEWIDESFAPGYTGTDNPRNAFAELAGVSSANLHRLCSGARSPGLAVAARIAEATGGGVPISYWL